MSNEPTLQQLILDEKARRDMTYGDMAAAAGGAFTERGIQKLVTTKTFKAFPDVKTLEGVATVFNLPTRVVLHAAGRSLGMTVRESDPEDLVLYRAGGLPQESQELLQNTARNLLWWQDQAAKERGSERVDSVTQLRPAPNWGAAAADKGEAGVSDDELPHDS